MTDINVVAENLVELLTNTVNMTDVFYDLFINPTPTDVTLWQYDSDNQLIEVTVPNRAKDRKISLTGTVDPASSTDPLVQDAAVGVCYVNTATNDVYFRVKATGADLWTQVAVGGDITAAINSLRNEINTSLSAYVPKTTTINTHPLSTDITLDAEDIGALSSTSTVYGTSLDYDPDTSTLTLERANGEPSTVTLMGASGTEANQDLSNITATGVARIQAVKGYEQAETAWLSDTTLYTYIKGLYDASSTSGTDTYTISDTSVSIPYKVASTGSKIVLSTSLTGVQSVYASEGYALYYVIDTTNQKVMLPMGEIFGFIRTALDKIPNTITYWGS